MKDIDTRKLCEVNDVLYKINRNGISGPTEVIVTSAKQMSLGHYAYKHNENERYSFINFLFKAHFLILSNSFSASSFVLNKEYPMFLLKKEYLSFSLCLYA